MGRMKDFFSESNDEIVQKILQYNNTLAERVRQLERDLEEAKSEIISLETKIDYLECYEKDRS